LEAQATLGVSRRRGLTFTRIYLKGKLFPHPFEQELEWFVVTNHKLLMVNITRSEQNAIAAADHGDLPEIELFTKELRSSANNLALVGLVTRFHHWISVFVEELTRQSARDRKLENSLKLLNKKFGQGPVPVDFFMGLVTVRDSIVHSDSKIQWEYRGETRKIPDKYANVESEEVEFTPEHLQEAIEKSLKQITWYHERFDPRYKP
jgi:hypothetical protein